MFANSKCVFFGPLPLIDVILFIEMRYWYHLLASERVETTDKHSTFSKIVSKKPISSNNFILFLGGKCFKKKSLQKKIQIKKAQI